MRLIFHRGPWAGREIVTALPMLRIGSDAAVNDLVLTDPQLAAAHCILQRSPRGEYILEDLSQMGSSMIINGQVAAEESAIYLGIGDRFHLGTSEIEVADASPKLIQTAGERAGLEIPLGAALTSIGRAPDNSIEIADGEASIYHAVIRCTEVGFSLEDQRSTNGSFVNEQKVASHLLQDGDLLRIGHQEFLFMVNDVEEEQSAPSSRSASDPVKATLTFLSGAMRDQLVEIAGQPVIIGSAPDCTYVVTDPNVDSAQFSIFLKDDVFHLDDLGSANRTLLNNRVLLKHPEVLQAGDLISIGSNVLEFQILGGVTSVGGMSMMMTSVIAAGAVDITPQPKFIVNGHVEVSSEIIVGTSPSCHLRLDGDGIGPLHCRILWNGVFYIEDTSVHGTYLGDKRIVSELLLDGTVIRVGREFIDVSIQGQRCNLDVIDRKTAMAAIEVAHETEFDLAQAVLDPANIGGAVSTAYKTVFKLNVADVDSLVRERKEKFREGAPTWRPSSDIVRVRTTKIGVVLTLLASLAVAFFALRHNQISPALNNHTLSESHSSVLFIQRAEENGVPKDCRACHSVGTGVTEKQCLRCHSGFENTIRFEHRDTGQSLAKGQTLPESTCAGCHREHLATPRYVFGAPSVLDASRGCTASQCHTRQHNNGFKETISRSPNQITAGPVPTFDIPIEQFHVAHASIELAGKQISIACTTCHATQDEATGALVETAPGTSCFGCHSGSERVLVSRQCLSCHGQEHGNDHGFERVAKNSPLMAAATAPATPKRSLAWAGLILSVIFAPLLGFAFFLRTRSRRVNKRAVLQFNQHPVETIKHLVHSLNEEKCVGCHACVQACPTNVLELVNHKSKIVNFDACIQCKACENSCAFGALVMHDADKPPPTTETPDLDSGLQTQVPGMYLIGQASGVPQVKNASNMGRSVIEKAVQNGMVAGEGLQVGAQADVIIIGSGPAGLSAAITCGQHGLSALILEKQANFAWTIRNYFHKGKEVMAEPHSVNLIGYLPIWDTNREELLAAWEQVIQQQQLQIQYRQDVTNIEKVGTHFSITTSSAEGETRWTSARVVIAVGGLGNPRTLGCPGDNLDKVRSALVDPDEFHGKNIVVVGGTDSAIEVALALCENNTVWLSCRGAKIDRAKPANRKRIEEAFSSGKVIAKFATAVFNVTNASVVLEDRRNAAQEELPNDYIFALIGGISPNKWLGSLGVQYVMKPHNWSPPKSDEMG